MSISGGTFKDPLNVQWYKRGQVTYDWKAFTGLNHSRNLGTLNANNFFKKLDWNQSQKLDCKTQEKNTMAPSVWILEAGRTGSKAGFTPPSWAHLLTCTVESNCHCTRLQEDAKTPDFSPYVQVLVYSNHQICGPSTLPASFPFLCFEIQEITFFVRESCTWSRTWEYIEESKCDLHNVAGASFKNTSFMLHRMCSQSKVDSLPTANKFSFTFSREIN